jgi:hypothetical protein
MTNSKTDRSIYKPKGSHRVSKRRRYKMPSKIYGGSVQTDGEGNPIESPDMDTPPEETEKPESKGVFATLRDVIVGAAGEAKQSAVEEANKAKELVSADDSTPTIPADSVNISPVSLTNDDLETKIQELEAKIQVLEADNQNKTQQIEDLHVQLEQEKDKVNDALQKHLETLSTMQNANIAASDEIEPSAESNMDTAITSPEELEVASPSLEESNMDTASSTPEKSDLDTVSSTPEKSEIEAANPSLEESNMDTASSTPEKSDAAYGGKNRKTRRRRTKPQSLA